MSLDFLTNMQIPVVFGICLIVGFILKKFIKDLDNKFIPLILAVLGAVLACVAQDGITLETILAGMFSGMSSTGFHQIFKQLISENSDETK